MTSALSTLRLGVNIDHIATLRQVRRARYPDLLAAVALVEEAGADIITLHLREDRRHIQDADVYALKPVLRTAMNLEMAATPAMHAVALDVLPRAVCLVPESREELTTEGGLDVITHEARLREFCADLIAAGIEVSLFIEPDALHLEAAARIGAPVVELHTGAYANAAVGAERDQHLAGIAEAARVGESLGLVINAGHGLDYENVAPIAALPQMHELNIGHAIIAHAVFVGIAQAVREMRSAMQAGRAACR